MSSHLIPDNDETMLGLVLREVVELNSHGTLFVRCLIFTISLTGFLVTKIGEATEAPVVVCLGAGIPRGVVTFCMGAPSVSLVEVTEGE